MTLALPPLQTSYDTDETDAINAWTQPEEPLMDDAAPPPDANDYACKIDGCTNRATAKMGRYAYLCADHRGTVAAKPDAKKRRTRKPASARASSNGHVTRSRAELLGLLVAKQKEIDTTASRMGELEQELYDLVDELGKTRA